MRSIISPNTLQVAILETGKQIIVAIGVVTAGYNTGKMPGWEDGTVGYQSDGNICDAENNERGRQTKGITRCRNRTFCKSYYSGTPLIWIPKGHNNMVNGHLAHLQTLPTIKRVRLVVKMNVTR